MIQNLYRKSLSPFNIPGISLLAGIDPVSALIARHSSYPPHNIEQKGENSFLLSFSVPGFSPDELTVQEEDGVLTVAGSQARKSEENDCVFLHRGIVSRAFDHTFRLDPRIKVGAARLSNGILSIKLTREVPDEAKPRRIDIETAGDETPEPVSAA